MDNLPVPFVIPMSNPFPEIIDDITANLPPSNFPLMPPNDGPELPFETATTRALAESADEFSAFVSENLTSYGARTATAIRTTAEAYSDAFQGLAGVLAGFAPEPGAGGGGGDTPGMATALALASGFDNLGQAVALSLGDQDDFGGVFAAQVIGEALTGAGVDIAAGFATGADIIEALGTAIRENAPGQEDPPADGDGPEGQFVEAINDGFMALVDGYNEGAQVVTGTLPTQIADGITLVGKTFLLGAGEVTSTIAGEIEQFMLMGGGQGIEFPPEGAEFLDALPVGPNDLLSAIQDTVVSPITSALNLEDFSLPLGDVVPL